jgi:CheY-like chemotaxis protein
MPTKKILLVEDEGMIVLDLRRILEKFGYDIPFVASRGEEAVKIAVEGKPDLVLMDITLKGEMDGIEAAKKIIALNIPVVYMTGDSGNITLKNATQMPIYGYIVKPFIEEELIRTIEIALTKHQLDIARIEKFKQNFMVKKENIPDNIINNLINPHIMTIKDNKLNPNDIVGKLKYIGYNIADTVTSGDEARVKAKKLYSDLLLRDIMLRDKLDGIAVTQQEDINK